MVEEHAHDIIARIAKKINGFCTENYGRGTFNRAANCKIKLHDLLVRDGAIDTAALNCWKKTAEVWKGFRTALSTYCQIELENKGVKTEIQVKKESRVEQAFVILWTSKFPLHLCDVPPTPRLHNSQGLFLGKPHPAIVPPFNADIPDALPTLIEEMSPDDETSPVQSPSLQSPSPPSTSPALHPTAELAATTSSCTNERKTGDSSAQFGKRKRRALQSPRPPWVPGTVVPPPWAVGVGW